MHNISIYIIVPVYNVEKFLHRCVNSLINQSYSDLQIILVDDGSPDKCPLICDEYAKKDSRIHVIHKPNAGLSSARNAGLAFLVNAALSSESTFVGFLDSDDWIADDTIEHCAKLIEENQADIVQYQICETYRNDIIIKQPKEQISTYLGRNEILQFYMQSTTSGVGGDYSVCQCLFNFNVLNGLSFREGKINEDIDFKYKAFANANSLVVSNQYKYYYWQGDVSTSFGKLKKKDFDLYEVADIIEELTSQETYKDIAFLGKVKKARTALSLLCKIAYLGIADRTIDKREILSKLTKEHRSNMWILIKSPIPMSRKLLTVLFAINYNLAEACIRIVKR